jgi:uncharacterized protein (DUF885 family)
MMVRVDQSWNGDGVAGGDGAGGPKRSRRVQADLLDFSLFDVNEAAVENAVARVHYHQRVNIADEQCGRSHESNPDSTKIVPNFGASGFAAARLRYDGGKPMRILLAFPLLAAAICAAQTPADFNRLVDRYFDGAVFHFNPTQATAAGFHQYDRQFEDVSKTNLDAAAAQNRRFLKEFENFDPRSLDAATRADRDLVIANIRGALLEQAEIRTWEKDPDSYSSGLTFSAFTLMSRKFAPPAERLASLIARERQMPKALAEARKNLKNPPRVFTEVALEQLPGLIQFFRNDVPAAFHEVADKKLLADFHASNQAVIDALTGYQKFVKEELLPRSQGDFRIGAENYRKKLLYDQMVDVPFDRLLEIGYQDLRKNQQAFRQTAAAIDPHKTPSQVLSDLEKDHPAPGELLAAFRDVLGGLRRFVVDHRIVDIPSPVPPIVEETPPFMRALTTASMDIPGAYERVAKEAFFHVTLPEANWSHKQTAEFMDGFSRGVIASTAIHEAYPGHYVQFLWLQQAPSKVRKLIVAGSNAEGWAHYTEQMMLDQGYGNGDPKLRLGQLQDALLRDARYIVGISMHTGKMTFDQGIDFFVKEGYQTPAIAERETKRGTSDPTYLVYTVGKLEILKLREDYKKLRGDKFTLLDFHDNFMKQGIPPIKIVRRALLGNDSPVL